MGHFIAESGRGKSVLDGNFGVLMKHVRKVVNANLKDITFAANLKDALGQLGGVKGNLVKEIVLDRATELQVKKAALPGLKKCITEFTPITIRNNLCSWLFLKILSVLAKAKCILQQN